MDKTKYVITINDVLKKSYAKVRGIEFDTHAECSLEKIGYDGEPEIVSSEMKGIYIVAHGEVLETFLLDRSSFNIQWLKELQIEIDKIALNEAKNSNKWERIDYDY